MRSRGIAATARRYTGNSTSETIERTEANGVMTRSVQYVRETTNRARSRIGGDAVKPKTSELETTNTRTASAMAPRIPSVAATGPASGAPTMLPRKYEPNTSPRARPSAARGVVEASGAERTGTPARPDQ